MMRRFTTMILFGLLPLCANAQAVRPAGEPIPAAGVFTGAGFVGWAASLPELSPSLDSESSLSADEVLGRIALEAAPLLREGPVKAEVRDGAILVSPVSRPESKPVRIEIKGAAKDPRHAAIGRQLRTALQSDQAAGGESTQSDAVLDQLFDLNRKPIDPVAAPSSVGLGELVTQGAAPAQTLEALSEQYDLISRVKKMSKLQNLASKDPEAAVEYASSILHDPRESRPEVRISAMRVLDKIRSPRALAVVIEMVKGEDSWYLRREAAKVLGEAAPTLQLSTREEAQRALSQAYEAERSSTPDFQSQSVRLMLRQALARFGSEPAAEPELQRSEDAKPVSFWKKSITKELWPQAKPWIGKVLFVIGILWCLGFLMMFAGPLLHLMPWGPSPLGFEKPNPYWAQYLGYTFGPLLVAALVVGVAYGGYALQKEWSKKPDRGETPKVRFSDIAGIDDAAVEIQEVMDFLKDPKKYQRTGAHPPKGVLLVGPPGTGKTLLAKALAGESKSSYYQAVGSDFVEVYVGVGASRVRALFSKAKNHAPAVIFIDELDAIGGARNDSLNRSSEDDKTLTALLAEMDGFDNSNGVIIIAATNRPESLDPALKRPGRFDRMINVSLPDRLGREAILQLHASKIRLGADSDLASIAQRTNGLSGAFLENIINEAAVLAARRNADSVAMRDLVEAADRQTVGQKRNFFVSDEEKLKTARHEAGHAVVELALGGHLEKLTIVPHGAGSLGHALPSTGEDERHGYTRSDLEKRMAMAFGGLAAEEWLYGEASTGPGSDLDHATGIARMMVEQLGMGKRSGYEVHARQGQHPGLRPTSEETKREIDLDIRDILNQAHSKAVETLKAHQAGFEALVAGLLEKETLTGAEIEELVKGPGVP